MSRDSIDKIIIEKEKELKIAEDDRLLLEEKNNRLKKAITRLKLIKHDVDQLILKSSYNTCNLKRLISEYKRAYFKPE